MTKNKPASKPDTKFARGYFCAVAVALKEEGNPTTLVRSLFSCGGGAKGALEADPEDQEVFREHGMME